MTKEEAIKYLQQLYPNGGHCWLDEQRIKAIGMAIKALQEEPVSEDLENEIDIYLATRKWREINETFSADRLVNFAHHFANWQKKKYDIIGKDLEEAAENYAQEAYSHPVDREVGKADFILGAKWQLSNLNKHETSRS